MSDDDSCIEDLINIKTKIVENNQPQQQCVNVEDLIGINVPQIEAVQNIEDIQNVEDIIKQPSEQRNIENSDTDDSMIEQLISIETKKQPKFQLKSTQQDIQDIQDIMKPQAVEVAGIEQVLMEQNVESIEQLMIRNIGGFKAESTPNYIAEPQTIEEAILQQQTTDDNPLNKNIEITIENEEEQTENTQQTDTTQHGLTPFILTNMPVEQPSQPQIIEIENENCSQLQQELEQQLQHQFQKVMLYNQQLLKDQINSMMREQAKQLQEDIFKSIPEQTKQALQQKEYQNLQTMVAQIKQFEQETINYQKEEVKKIIREEIDRQLKIHIDQVLVSKKVVEERQKTKQSLAKLNVKLTEQLAKAKQGCYNQMLSISSGIDKINKQVK
ncbi:Hypothetical_protein [Hexamita inflata]|uniref:Hypothetical_protein n=1 Tax=Hexamita inflata TaxID=28002 RepID=A0AA86QEC7_9EUKA|nr:Hypothetical protein HINF_LOCUS45364 [Hexamita inflata]